MHTLLKKTTECILIILILSSCYQSEEADLVVHNATIYSVDQEFSTHEAMAIKDGKIIELGPEREILNRYSAKEKIDAKKQFVYPGFFDAHSHFLGFAQNKGELNLFGVKSYEELLKRSADFAKNSNREWLVGRGWDQNLWEDNSFPTKTGLDSLFPDRPVFLTRVDGHAALLNSEAMKRAGITDTSQIAGGAILKGKDGKPTGVLVDKAADQVENTIPPMDVDQRLDLLKKAERECFEAGLTSVTDAGLFVEDIELLDSLSSGGDLKIRIYAMLAQSEDAKEFMKNGPYKTNRLHVSSLKIYTDGALGSRGALLKAPYSDDPDNYGLKLIKDSVFNEYLNLAFESGFQVCSHGIGDSANAYILKNYAKVLNGMNDLRWRVEHAQIVDPEDLHLFKNFGIIPSVQPVHATSDKSWAEERLGPERIEYAYAYNTLKSQLGWIPLGTDFPVEPISPIENFYAAVFRKSPHREEPKGYRTEEALTREDALRGLTFWPALASFEEKEKGSLEPGKFADFVILDTDLMKATEKRILSTKVVATYLDGVKVN